MKRLAHLESHLRRRNIQRGWMLGDELVPLLRLLLTPMTIQEIADELGPGWTWRLVEYRYHMIRDSLAVRPSRQHLERMELLRVAMGLDPCPCEDAAEWQKAS